MFLFPAELTGEETEGKGGGGGGGGGLNRLV